MTDEQIIRRALGAYSSAKRPKAHVALDRLVAERDAAVGRANAAEYARRKDNEYLLARAEAAEKERDALTRVATEYQTALANEQARCATLEAALERVACEGCPDCASFARSTLDALAASQPAEET